MRTCNLRAPKKRPALPKERRPCDSTVSRLSAGRALNVDAELALVVVEAVVVDAKEQLARCRHDDGRLVADAERLSVRADAADQRAGERAGKRCVVRAAPALRASRARDVVAVGAQLNFTARIERQHFALADGEAGRGPRLLRRNRDARAG